MVPIVEPEVLMDGEHSAKECYQKTSEALYVSIASDRALQWKPIITKSGKFGSLSSSLKSLLYLDDSPNQELLKKGIPLDEKNSFI